MIELEINFSSEDKMVQVSVTFSIESDFNEYSSIPWMKRALCLHSHELFSVACCFHFHFFQRFIYRFAIKTFASNECVRYHWFFRRNYVSLLFFFFSVSPRFSRIWNGMNVQISISFLYPIVWPFAQAICNKAEKGVIKTKTEWIVWAQFSRVFSLLHRKSVQVSMTHRRWHEIDGNKTNRQTCAKTKREKRMIQFAIWLAIVVYIAHLHFSRLLFTFLLVDFRLVFIARSDN